MEKKTKKTESTNEVKKAKAVKKELTAKEREKVPGGGGSATPYYEMLFMSIKCPKCGSYDFGWVDPVDWWVVDLYCSHCHESSSNFPFY